MITAKMIDPARREDINIKNEPFRLFGRMIPVYTDETWGYTVERLAEADITEMCFPNENYDYDALAANSVFVGAYDGDVCIGLAILQQAWFKYMYLYDLKVNAAFRGRRVGTM